MLVGAAAQHDLACYQPKFMRSPVGDVARKEIFQVPLQAMSPATGLASAATQIDVVGSQSWNSLVGTAA